MIQAHYTPNGSPQTDQSEVALVFADAKTGEEGSYAHGGDQFPASAFRREPKTTSSQATHGFEEDTLLFP